jgi:hypothetical protein
MLNLVFLAGGKDLSSGFADFFATIGMTGSGLVTKGVAAVIAVIAVIMLLKLPSNAKEALRRGSVAVGTLFVAVILAMYGPTLFSTVTDADTGKPDTSHSKKG